MQISKGPDGRPSQFCYIKTTVSLYINEEILEWRKILQ